MVADYGPGASCNDSVEDEHGWDHVIEFDEGRQTHGASADLGAAMPAVFVQIKTTASAKIGHVQMKLSNALRLTQSDNPCFVVLIAMRDGEPASYRVIHWWTDEMATTLRRVRELHLEGVGVNGLHRHRIRIGLSSSAERAASDLIGWIRTEVMTTGAPYALVKSTLRANLGYDGWPLVGAMSIGPLKSIEELVDHQLGLTPNVPLEGVTLNHRRFGIDLPIPVPNWPIVQARIHAHPAADCEVRVRGPGDDEFVLPGQLFVPAVPGLTDDQLKYRVRTSMFDLVWRPGSTSRFTASFDTATRITPAELLNRAKFFGWAGGSPIDIMVTTGEERLLGATATLDEQKDSGGWRRLAGPLEILASIAADHRGAPPTISVEEAMEAPHLPLLHAAIVSTETRLAATLPASIDLGAVDHAICFAALTVGSWNFGVLLRLPVTRVERVSDDLTISMGKARRLESYVGDVSDRRPVERLKSDYRRYAAGQGAFELDNLLLHLAGEYFSLPNGGRSREDS